MHEAWRVAFDPGACTCDIGYRGITEDFRPNPHSCDCSPYTCLQPEATGKKLGELVLECGGSRSVINYIHGKGSIQIESLNCLLLKAEKEGFYGKHTNLFIFFTKCFSPGTYMRHFIFWKRALDCHGAKDHGVEQRFYNAYFAVVRETVKRKKRKR